MLIADLRRVAGDINKSLDAEVAISGVDACLSDVHQVVPTSSVMLNLLLGGGVPVGRFMEIFGDQSMGKCQSGGTYVMHGHSLVTLDEMCREACDFPLLLSSSSVHSPSIISFDGLRDVYEVVTRSGYTNTATEDHRHVVFREGVYVNVKVADLKVGDYLVIARGCIDPSKSAVGSDDGYLLGVFTADAHLGYNRIIISNDDISVLHFLIEHGTAAIGFKPLRYIKGESVALHWNSIHNVHAFYDKWGISPALSSIKTVPYSVRAGPLSVLVGFLQGYFDCDSSCSVGVNRCIEVTSASYELLMQIKIILSSLFGIVGKLSPKNAAAYPGNDYWRFSLLGTNAVLFAKKVGSRSAKVQERYIELIASLSPVSDDAVSGNIPCMNQVVRSLYRASKGKTTRAHHRVTTGIRNDNGSLTYALLDKILALSWVECPELDCLRRIRLDHYFYDPVMLIRAVGEAHVYDVQVLGQSNALFVANGILTHNSTLVEHMMVGFQRFPGISILLDAESGWDRARALRMGHDQDHHMHLQTDTVELGFKAIHEVIDRMRMPGSKFPLSMPLGFFWDTISASQTEGEKEGNQYKDGMSDKARKIRQELRKLSLKLPRTNCALVFVSQTITDIKAQTYGKGPVKKSASGGDAISFWSSKRIKVWYQSKIHYPQENSGIITTACTVKDKMRPPNCKVDLPIMFSVGVDPYYEVFNYLLDNSAWVNMSGSRVVIPDFPEPGEELCFYPKQLYKIVEKYPDLLQYMRNCAESAWAEKHNG